MERTEFNGSMQGSVDLNPEGDSDDAGRALMEQLLADPTHDYRVEVWRRDGRHDHAS